MSIEPVVVERTYNVPIAVVWKAITEQPQMVQWYFNAIEDFRAEVGFETQFSIHHDGVDYVHQWKVTDVVPGTRIVYDWHYEGIPGESYVTWELSTTPEGTKLTFAHAGLTFPQDNPAFTREATQAGWDYFLQGTLPKYLEGLTA